MMLPVCHDVLHTADEALFWQVNSATCLVHLGYTLSVPTLAGPICAENKRLKNWLK